MLIDFVNMIIIFFSDVFNWVLNLLPVSPFSSVNNGDVQQFLGNLSWVIPFQQITAELELFVTAAISYYAVMVILRWIKAIG